VSAISDSDDGHLAKCTWRNRIVAADLVDQMSDTGRTEGPLNPEDVVDILRRRHNKLKADLRLRVAR